MSLWTWMRARTGGSAPSTETDRKTPRLVTDGGEPQDAEDPEESDADAEDPEDGESDGPSNIKTSNIEITEAGEAEPAEPKWEKPDVDDIPEFEVRADKPMVESSSDPADETGQMSGTGEDQVDPTASPGVDDDDPTAGMPNSARSPGNTRIKREGSEGFIVALELCSRLPEEARLPDEANDLVPVALEAELEQDIQQFAASEFDNPSPLVSTLDFHDIDGEIWMRIRVGAEPEAFENVNVEELRSHALQEVEGML